MLDVIRSNAQSWGVKIAFGIIIIVFCFWGVGSFTGGPSSEILTVNGEGIGYSDLMIESKQLEERVRQNQPGISAEELKKLQLRRYAAQQLVTEAILGQEARRIGLSVTPVELRKAIEGIAAFHDASGKFDSEAYKRFIAGQYNNSFGAFEERIRKDLLQRKLIQAVTGGIAVTENEAREVYRFGNEQRAVDYVFFSKRDYADGSAPKAEAVRAWYDNHQQDYKVPATADVTWLLVGAESLAPAFPPDEAAIKAFYETNKDRFVVPEQVRARHILIKAPEDPALNAAAKQADEKALAGITALHKRLLAGEDFGKLAKQHSEDPGSGAQGGELGWFEAEQMVPAFSETAFALKPGEISKPFRTSFGYHIVQTEEKRPVSTQPLEAVREEINARLGAEQAAGKLQDTLDQILLAVMGGKTLAEAGAPYKLTPQETGALTAGELSARLGLKPEDAAALLAVKPGTLRDTPFVTPKGYVLARVNAATPESILPFDKVKGDIEASLASETQVSKAKAAAQAALAQKPVEGKLPALEARAKASQTFGRGTQIAEVGGSPEMLRDVFNAEKGVWLPTAYTVDSGAVLLRVREIAPAPDELWDQIKTNLMDTLTQARREQAYRAFMQNLQAKAKVVVNNEQVLNGEN